MSTKIISNAESSWLLLGGQQCINSFFHDVYTCETVFVMYMQTVQSKSSSGSGDATRSNGQYGCIMVLDIIKATICK